MFSKALFKQSMKANWIKWVSVTVSTCVMLAIVIIVLGNLAINDIRDSLKNVFVQANQESYLKENTVDSYQLYMTSLDSYNQIAGYGAYIPIITSNYNSRVQAHETQYGTTPTDEEKQDYINQTSDELGGLATMIGKNPEEMKALISQLLNFYIQQNPQIEGVELLDAFFINSIYVSSYEYALTKPDATNETALNEADKAKDIATDAILVYKTDAMEADFVYNSENYILTANSYVNLMMFNEAYNNAISEGYSSDEAKQIAVSVKVIANTAISTYYLWLNEFESQNNGEPLTQQQIQDAKSEACKSISDQIQDEKVVEALTELGNMDMYGLIIGSIFYRIAGLLLPMVFVIMTANGLLAGQVDSGSMAYTLSTPTKRRTVTVTQMSYLIVALLAMYALLTAVSVVSVWIVGGNDFAINFAEILLFNAGAFLTMFAIAGFCFMCSAIFNRTKYSLSVGGGLTIFALVCTILGLFGSGVVPSAMRITAMDFFNYLSIITLFDTVSILDGTLDFLWKFGILFAVGVVTFIIGIFRFDKKDLPL